MKSVRDAFVNLWRRLDWFERVIAFIFVGGVGFSAVVGDAMSTTWFAVILALWCCAAYWRNTALGHRSEINHLRTALRDSVRPSEFTIQKPTAYQITVGGKTPECQPNRDVVAAVETAELRWREAAERRAEVMGNVDASRDARWSARCRAEDAQRALNRARENAANELARLAALVDGDATPGAPSPEVVISNDIHVTDWKAALGKAIDPTNLRRGGR